MKKIFTLLLLVSSIYVAEAQVPCIVNTSSVNFNGTSDYVSLTNDGALDITDSITVEAWVRAIQWGATAAQGSIVCNHGWFTGEAGYVLRAGGNGVLSFNIGGQDTMGVPTSWKEVISPDSALALNVWEHVAGTYDGSDLKVYVNGVLVGTTHFVGTILPSPNYHVKFGRIADDNEFPQRFWNGKIDEVRIWHRALGSAEILSHSHQHIDPTMVTGLAGYWRLNENTGTTANDLGPNGITGTLMGATWGTVVPFNNVPFAPVITLMGTSLHSNAATGIQWYLNGNLLPGDTLQNLPITLNGAYTVVVTNVYGCTAVSLPYNVVNAGINENEFDNSINITPNPAHHFLSVRFNDATLYDHLVIADVAGKILMQQPLKTNNINIDISGLSEGIYFVRLLGDHSVAMRRLVVE